jgi:hypothetical protein
MPKIFKKRKVEVEVPEGATWAKVVFFDDNDEYVDETPGFYNLRHLKPIFEDKETN